MNAIISGLMRNSIATDDWGLAAVSEELQPEEKALSKAEYDHLIAAGLLAEERNNMKFDVFE